MSIRFLEDKKVFLLDTPGTTYVIRLFDGKYLLHGGWFKKIHEWSDVTVTPMVEHAFSPVHNCYHDKIDFSMDAQQMEFPAACTTDFRNSALEVRSADGTLTQELLFDSYRISKGKPSLPGLPATYTNSDDEADSLEIILKDPVTGLEVSLSYTVWNIYDAITRSVTVKNMSQNASGIYTNKPLTINKIMSMSLDFMGSRYKMLQLSGAHARERHVVSRKLVPGLQAVESRRGVSSHQQNPFIALTDYNTTEENGNAFGFNLVYSGNFLAQIESDQLNMSRVQMGINPFNFEWTLSPGESFTAPETVMVYSTEGLGKMSRTFHDLYRKNLARGLWRDAERPVVINNWEATYFSFNAEKLFHLADTAAREGIELFVLDDGWFGKRNDDRSSLGDWFVNNEKLPGGLEEIADGIHQRGMKFGLWFEPEMISPDSELYRKHPDWCLHVPSRASSLSRHQLVLDLSRKDVTDYIFERLSFILSAVRIDYIKWDFNRHITEPGSASSSPEEQLSTGHRYMLGLYSLLEKITSSFPHILFESCSGGGGRFDPAMLYYMPQCWTSDNTDGLSRLAIQGGTSLCYPASSMSCHVSAVPNHQTGRFTSLSLRGHTAMAGTFGYELDLNQLNPVELQEIKEQVQLYKKIRNTVQFGDLYRLNSSWNETSDAEAASYNAWQLVSKDKKQSVLTIVWDFQEGNSEILQVFPKGLDSNSRYSLHCSSSQTIRAMLSMFPFPVPESQLTPFKDYITATGEELMNAGLRLVSSPMFGGSVQIILEKI